MAIICESPSFYPVRGWNFPTLGLRNPQYRSEGRHQFSSFLRLGMKGRDQYYSLAATTICFYDFFLTLADEVSCVANVSLAMFVTLSQKIKYAWHGKKSWGAQEESLVVRHLLTSWKCSWFSLWYVHLCNKARPF